MHLLDYLKDHIGDVDVNRQRRIFGEHGLAAPTPAGVDHYLLLIAIAQYYEKSTLIEVGTYHGSGAVALSQGNNRVISYDIADVRRLVNQPANVEFRLGDFRNDTADILSSPFIFIDVDPHDGVQEQAFHQWFLDKHYEGIVMWDDIRLNSAMRSWWDSVTLPKIDITNIGHWSGTGLIRYA